jgi:hypothetical protein
VRAKINDILATLEFRPKVGEIPDLFSRICNYFKHIDESLSIGFPRWRVVAL